MKGLQMLNCRKEIMDSIRMTASNYARFAKIDVSVLNVKPMPNGKQEVIIRVKQFKKNTDKVFTSKELIQKGKEVMSHLPDGYIVRYRPLTFSGVGVSAVSADWVKRKMKDNNIRQVDLCNALGIDKFVMSKLLNNKYEFTKWHKSTFFYFFEGFSS